MALRGEPTGMGAMPPDLAMATSAGWAWALVILGALKLGRQSAQSRALDYGHLEVCLILCLCTAGAIRSSGTAHLEFRLA